MSITAAESADTQYHQLNRYAPMSYIATKSADTRDDQMLNSHALLSIIATQSADTQDHQKLKKPQNKQKETSLGVKNKH